MKINTYLKNFITNCVLINNMKCLKKTNIVIQPTTRVRIKKQNRVDYTFSLLNPEE